MTSRGDHEPDDNLKGQCPRFEDTGTSVFNTSLRGFIASPLWQEIVVGADSIPARCRGCDWRRDCAGGGCFNLYGKATGFSRESLFCDALDEMHLDLAQYARRHGI